MKNLKTYIPSLILSVLLVFSFTGTSALIVGNSFANPEKLTALMEENEIVPMIRTELKNYFSDKYNETGIPAEVYTEALTDEYIKLAAENYIYAGLDKGASATYGYNALENEQLEKNITEFFSDYAESINYEKDAKYDDKLEATIKSAYSVIGDYCDVYKFKTMNDEGILEKTSGIYSNLSKIIMLAAGASLLLIAVILLINLKSVSAALYWVGISALISGIIGIIPCIYLNSTNYFDAFVIKQPHIFTSFTKLMYGAMDAFIMNQIILAAAGIVLIIVFSVIQKNIFRTKGA